MIKIKGLAITSLAMLMFLSPVFAADNSDDPTNSHHTDITYSVAESYKWSAPVDFSFTTNVDAESKVGTVSVIENIIGGGSTLKISIDPDAEFKLTSDEMATRDYSVSKDDVVLSKGDSVLTVPSGDNEAEQDLTFSLIGVISGNTSQTAGTFRGLLNFVANIETAGSGSGGNSGGTGGSGGSSGGSTISKGDILTMAQLGYVNVDMNGDDVVDTFRVLSVDGNQAKVLAMDSYKSSVFNSKMSNTYANSTLDAEMTNYYNALPKVVQNAIVEQDINQSKYYYNLSSSESDDFSSWSKPNFTESDTIDSAEKIFYLSRITENNVGKRHVYALDLDDVIAYLGPTSTPQDVNELFFNQRSGTSNNTDYDFWLRSADSSTSFFVFNILGRQGSVFATGSGGKIQVRPAFVLNLG